MMGTRLLHKISPWEYLVGEPQATAKHEYWNGNCLKLPCALY
jgi:hypothetical protein